jgi:CRISPR-associated protein Cas1
MEEFRAIADRLALTLINRGQLSTKDFEAREGGAVMLAPTARKTVLIAYQERKQENLAHPLLAESIPLGLVPQIQARLMARTLRGDLPDYLPFLVR